jgi:hypothetical protein
MATGYGLDDQGVEVRFPVGERDFSLLHDFQIVSGGHPASYTTDTGAGFPGSKAAGA